MTSILICSTPVIGHIAPILPVAQALVAAGADVRFLTGAKYRDEVEATGARFLPLPAEADFDDAAIDEAFPGRVGLTGPAAIKYDLVEIFFRPGPAQLAAVDAALAAEPADAVLAESMFAGGAGLTMRPRGSRPALLNLGIIPLGLASRDTAPFGLGIPPLRGPLGVLRNRALAFVANRLIFGSVHREAERLLAPLGGASLPTHVMNWYAATDAVLQFTVEEFEYPRSDAAVPIHFLGPVSRSGASQVALPEWWDDLDGSRPVVHVTQGTIANGDPEELLLPTIRGLADDDVIVVASTGGRALDLGPLPSNTRVAQYLPYDELLARTDVMVTNGGYGGVHFALRNGVPLVVAGMTEDKAEVSARVAWSGAGINLRTNRPSADEVAGAVRRVLADPGYAAASERIGQSIRRAPGVEGVLDIVRRYAPERAAQ